jgi:type IV pilus assembly protein PilC
MNAFSEEDVRRELLQQGYIPISIKELRTSTSGGFSLNMDIGKKGLKLKATEVAAFTRGLHQLLRAGISVPMAVEALGKDADNPRLTEVCQDISARIINGSPISEAFAQHPRTFDEVFVGYLESGERTGTLVNATHRLALLTEKRAQLRTKVKAVSTYPILVSIVIGLILSGIITILVPQYARIYAEFNSQLPAPTLFLVALSHHFLPLTLWHHYPIPNFTSPIFWLIVIIFGTRFYLKKTADNPAVGMRVDKIRFHLPLAGKLIHYTALYSWITTLAGALETGVRTTAAVNMASRVSGSRWIKTISPDIEQHLQSGVPLSKLLGDYPEIFPANLRTMVATGETSGELTTMLDSAAVAISEEIDALVSGLSAKVEVALIMVLGICVGSMLIALYLPIIKLDETVSNTASSVTTTVATTVTTLLNH